MILEILKDRYSVCKPERMPEFEKNEDFISITVTDDEISLVCTEKHVPKNCEVQSGFCAMRVKGHLDFSLTGIIARISGVLSEEGISIFVLSTYDTDYIFIKEEQLRKSVDALEKSGYVFERK